MNPAMNGHGGTVTPGGSRTGGNAPTGRPTPRTAIRTGSQTRAQLSSRSSVPRPHVRRWENQATRLKWQSPPPIAPQSSAGSTSMVPIARQDKRAADVMESGEPTKRSNRPPPQPKEAIVRKWREWILLQQLLKDLRAAGAADLLADHVARGHFVNRHSDFHQHPKCREVPRQATGCWPNLVS